MTAQEFLQQATKTLERAGIPSARLDCLILLEDALGRDRAVILAYPETDIHKEQLTILNKQITQRAKHTPLAYIRGKTLFYGREFQVNRHVLVPRPETETMIELLKTLPLPANPRLADIGSGSGCIGITAALELPGASAELYDIDPKALRIAAHNARVLKAKAACCKSDLLDKNPAVGVLAANLPYVPERYSINQAAEHEPKHAIFSGKDGLNLYRRFWQEVSALPHKPLFILTESLPTQHQKLSNLAHAAGYAQINAQDFIQVFTPA